MQLLDGKKSSDRILNQLREQTGQLASTIGRVPRLDMILVGEDYGSQKYVAMKEKRAREIGFEGVVHRLPAQTTTHDLLNKVEELNLYSGVDGFMIQLPLPAHIEEEVVLAAIDPTKDVDGLSSINLGKLFQNDPTAIVSATPMGIMLLLKEYNIELEGLNALIIGRSKIVGLPMCALLNNANVTVTMAHSKSRDLPTIAQKADIIISAVGLARFVTADFIQPGAIVIDVGTNKGSEGNAIVGDVDFLSVAPLTSYITPVPGGVGPMTIAALMWNTFEVWKRSSQKSN